VPGPQAAELVALQRELPDELGEPRVVEVGAGGGAQGRDCLLRDRVEVGELSRAAGSRKTRRTMLRSVANPSWSIPASALKARTSR